VDNITIENNLMVDPRALAILIFWQMGENIVIRNNLFFAFLRSAKYCDDDPPVPPNPFWDQIGGDAVLAGGPLGMQQMADDKWMGCSNPPCNPMATAKADAGDRYRIAIQVKGTLGTGVTSPAGLELYNNILVGPFAYSPTCDDPTGDCGEEADIKESHNVFVKFGGPGSPTEAMDSFTPSGSYIAWGDKYLGNCNAVPDLFESPGGVGSEWFFEEQPDLWCSKWYPDDPVKALQNWRVSNFSVPTPNYPGGIGAGSTFADPNYLPSDSLGGVGPDGFLLPNVPRDPDYPTVGPYQYVPKFGR